MSWHVHLGSGPDWDWKAVLISSFCLAVILIIISFVTFWSIKRGVDLDVSRRDEEEGYLLDLKTLRMTGRYYQDKQENFEKIIQSGTSSPTDPSL